ncbi:hypothetical protein [Gimesia maris]|uniref:hypothetical protein n=1 Tax=Gimesia maris TaxID=122 RepID=UPI003A931D40
MAKRLKALDEETNRLKKMVADQTLDILDDEVNHQGKPTPPQSRRAAVATFQHKFALSQRRAVRMLDQPRSS